MIYAEALKWFALAAAQGNATAQFSLRRPPSAPAAKEAAAQHLDPSSLDRAQARTDRYVVDYGQRPASLQ